MDRRVKYIIQLMEVSIRDKLTEKKMSQSVDVSTARLRELFKIDTGRTPVQYLRHLRIKTAARLLQTSFLTIKEISIESGARDVSHFVRDI